MMLPTGSRANNRMQLQESRVRALENIVKRIPSRYLNPASQAPYPNSFIGSGSGSGGWDVPAGVTRVLLVAIGAGGEGGASTYVNADLTLAGAGGGGGALIMAWLDSAALGSGLDYSISDSETVITLATGSLTALAGGDATTQTPGIGATINPAAQGYPFVGFCGFNGDPPAILTVATTSLGGGNNAIIGLTFSAGLGAPGFSGVMDEGGAVYGDGGNGATSGSGQSGGGGAVLILW